MTELLGLINLHTESAYHEASVKSVGPGPMIVSFARLLNLRRPLPLDHLPGGGLEWFPETRVGDNLVLGNVDLHRRGEEPAYLSECLQSPEVALVRPILPPLQVFAQVQGHPLPQFRPHASEPVLVEVGLAVGRNQTRGPNCLAMKEGHIQQP